MELMETIQFNLRNGCKGFIDRSSLQSDAPGMY